MTYRTAMAMAAKESTIPEGLHDLRHIYLEPNAVAGFWWFSSRGFALASCTPVLASRPLLRRAFQSDDAKTTVLLAHSASLRVFRRIALFHELIETVPADEDEAPLWWLALD